MLYEALILGLLLLSLLVVMVWFALRPRFLRNQWEKLAKELGGSFTPGKKNTNWPQPGQVKATHRGHKVSLSVFLEVVDTGDSVVHVPYIRLTITAHASLKRKLIVLRNWHLPVMGGGGGLSLPDHRFSDRYKIVLSEPQDFAMKVFHNAELRKTFSQTIGLRPRFYMHIEKRALTFSTRARNVFLPWSGIEWRIPYLLAMIDTLIDVLDAAEQAPEEPWPLTHLEALPEAAEATGLGEVQGEFTLQRVRYNVLGAVTLAIGLVLLLLAIVMMLGSNAFNLVCTGAALPFLVLGAALSRTRIERVLVYEGGLAMHRKGKTGRVAWDEIEHIWTRRLRRRKNVPTLVLKQGKRTLLKIDHTFPNRTQFLAILDERYLQPRVNRASAALKTGKKLTFGALEVDDVQLFAGEHVLPWNAITGLIVKKANLVATLQRHEEVVLGPVEDIPDVRILQALLKTQSAGSVPAGQDQRVVEAAYGEITQDPGYGVVLRHLHTFVGDSEKTFVIFENKRTKDFVQFLKLGPDGLLLDFPVHSLDMAKRERIQRFFALRGAEQEGQPEQDGVFQLEFLSDEEGLAEAAETALQVLRIVISPGPSTPLKITTG